MEKTFAPEGKLVKGVAAAMAKGSPTVSTRFGGMASAGAVCLSTIFLGEGNPSEVRH